jgi:RND family efflux transporter MFP subunit
VERGDLLEEVTESGRIAAEVEVDLKSKVSGEVVEVAVDEGEPVHKGQVLLRIDRMQYERDLDLTRVDLRRAELQLETADAERRRKEAALAAGGISSLEYDLAVRERDQAAIAVERGRIEVAIAADRLAWTEVRSPIDGTVIRRNIDPGEIVTAGVSALMDGEPQLTVAQLERLEMELNLNQVDVAKVTSDMEAVIELDAFPGVEVPGRVAMIAASGHRDDERGVDVFTVRVEVDATKTEVAIKPGMTADVRIRVASTPDVLKVPVETVFEDDGRMYLHVVRGEGSDRHKEKVEVTTGRRSQTEIEISSGLSDGDHIYAQAEVKDLRLEFD